MLIITVVDEDFFSGRDFAEALAQRLGLRLVDAEALVERAAAWGGDPKELRRAVERGSHFLDRFIGSKDLQITQLRGALSEDVREGRVVCYGVAAELLNLTAKQILRVRIRASHESRLLSMRQRLGLKTAEARRRLDQRERQRGRWRKHLVATRTAAPYGPGLLINLDETSVDEGCETVRHMLECQARFQPAEADFDRVNKWAVCCAVRAAIAQSPLTGRLSLDVAAERDTIVLTAVTPASDGGNFAPRFPASVRRSIQTALALYPGTQHLHPGVTINGDAIALGEVLGGSIEAYALQPVSAGVDAGSGSLRAAVADHGLSFASKHGLIGRLTHRLRLPVQRSVLLRPVAAVIAGLIVVSGLIYGGLSNRRNSQQSSGARLESFAGIITDSVCRVIPKGSLPDAACVRSCVRSGAAKYVLSEAGHALVISNQQLAGRFATRKVVVAGVLSGTTHELQIRSIRMAAP